MKSITTILLLWLLSLNIYASQPHFVINEQDYPHAAIVCEGKNAITRFAADELQKHLELITGYKFPVVAVKGTYKKVFFIGIIPLSDAKLLGAEEARYLVTKNAIYFYGEDYIKKESSTAAATAADLSINRVGTLFAVYNFLENEFGVRWFEPGDDGIYFSKSDKISIPTKSDSWSSYFEYQRGMRSYTWNFKNFEKYDKYIPDEFKMTEEQVNSRKLETDIWLRRMRMGNKSTYLPFSHSFTRWWEEYGLEHPEWFALTGNGTRAPMGDADRIKMCPSNPTLVDKKVELYRKKESPHHTDGTIDGTENDGGGGGVAEYCHCDKCMALDYLKPGEAFGANLTDRYVYFWSRLANQARQYDSSIIVTGYAYADMMNPPRTERLDAACAIEFVSRFNEDFSTTESLFTGWKNMGMKRMLFRPNDLCCDLGLPLGIEKRVFEHQEIAIRNNAVGTDHDCIYGFWTGISGITYYILAKAHTDPSKPFEYWENEYYSMFGNASYEISKFFRHWRDEVFNQRLYPADVEGRKKGNNEELLAWQRVGAYGRDVGKYYKNSDFDITDGYLKTALTKKLSPVQRRLVDRLIISNQHNRLSYLAMLSKSSKGKETDVNASKTLLQYRILHKNDLYMNWPLLFIKQVEYEDICGMAGLMLSERKREFDCLKINETPKIDGEPDEAFWQNTEVKTPFLVIPSWNNPIAPTSVSLAYDDEALYIAVICQESKMNGLREDATARDGAVYDDNAIELFFDPLKTSTDFLQIVISSGGALFDGIKLNDSYNSDFNLEIGKDIVYAVDKKSDFWSAEIKISFVALGIKSPRPGTSIKFNICRNRKVKDGIGNENSSLAALFASYQKPSEFVTLVFK